MDTPVRTHLPRLWLLASGLLLLMLGSCGSLVDPPEGTDAPPGPTVIGPDDPIRSSDRPSLEPVTSVPDPPPSGPPTASRPTLARVHAEVFTPQCAACHVDRSVPSAGFSLRWDATLRERLLAPATQAPDMPRITPGDPERSYLWHKVSGTHRQLGGRGERCPVDAPPLDEATMNLLRTWIESGDWE